MRIVTVGRFGSKMANFRVNGHVFSRPIWAVKIYVSENGKWKLAETLSGITVSGNAPSGTIESYGRKIANGLGLQYEPWTYRRDGRVVHGASTAPWEED
jgi:hypothetical protein